MVQANVKYFVMVLGSTLDSHKTFLNDLTMTHLEEVYSLDDSDVIIAFVPIVSRAGTDISTAMKKIPEGKPIVLVVLHHTSDQYYIAPDSRRCVNNDNVFAIDCLFHEDLGLLRCLRNDEAIRAVKDHLIKDVYSEVDCNYCTWILLVVFISLSTSMGLALSFGVGFIASHSKVNNSCNVEVVISGTIVGDVLTFFMVVIWVKHCYKARGVCQLM